MKWTVKYVLSRKTLFYTIGAIWGYYKSTGKDWFHYRTLRMYWDKNKMWKYSEWHSIERVVRELAQYGYLKRIGRGKFKITNDLKRLANALDMYLGQLRRES